MNFWNFIKNVIKPAKQNFKIAFPHSIHSDADLVESEILKCKSITHSVGEIANVPVRVGTEEVHIPYRIYFDELSDAQLSKMTDRQKTIAWCLYSRHHNGRLREKYISKLLGSVTDYAVPFVLQTLGEYVEEIGALISAKIEDRDVAIYKNFLSKNPDFSALLNARIVSYWNEYYRKKYPKIDEYPPYKLLTALGQDL